METSPKNQAKQDFFQWDPRVLETQWWKLTDITQNQDDPNKPYISQNQSLLSHRNPHWIYPTVVESQPIGMPPEISVANST